MIMTALEEAILLLFVPRLPGPSEDDLPCICICRLPGFNNDSL